jgi:hypothetical protein
MTANSGPALAEKMEELLDKAFNDELKQEVKSKRSVVLAFSDLKALGINSYSDADFFETQRRRCEVLIGDEEWTSRSNDYHFILSARLIELADLIGEQAWWIKELRVRIDRLDEMKSDRVTCDCICWRNGEVPDAYWKKLWLTPPTGTHAKRCKVNAHKPFKPKVINQAMASLEALVVAEALQAKQKQEALKAKAAADKAALEAAKFTISVASAGVKPTAAPPAPGLDLETLRTIAHSVLAGKSLFEIDAMTREQLLEALKEHAKKPAEIPAASELPALPADPPPAQPVHRPFVGKFATSQRKIT